LLSENAGASIHAEIINDGETLARSTRRSARKEGTNIVCAQDGKGVLIGNPAIGWQIVTPDLRVEVRTPQAVELMREELEIAPIGWS